ncbi:Asp23/Gls24 family envelope stress response protein [Actinokineospora sp. G85]|uniref:Asp23/Gls24 family envelope stress response protein n=1 Tax=Actinokineospora sp. G85 TaxID=3406626 RepID=UPI003C732C0A
MATTSSPQASSATEPSTPRAGMAPARLADDQSQGKTTIASNVVQKIAGMATREVTGVYAMGGGVSRAFGAIRERIPGAGTVSTSGVSVEVGEKQAAIDLDVVVEYGVGIVELARAVRRNVINAVERMTGLEVIEVNIAVNDIHLPDEGDEEPTPATSRVE